MGKVVKGLAKTVGGIIGDPLGFGAIDDAKNSQLGYANQANAMYERMYNQQRADLNPYNQAGQSALSGMQDADFSRDFAMSDYQADPGYQFRMAEGMKALENSAAARGSLNSGATLKAISRYGQDMASQEYQNAYNRFNADRDRRFGRLSSLAGIGANAAGQMAGVAGQYGSNVANTLTGMGNATAGAGMARANATQNLLKTGVSAFSGGMGG